MLDKEKEEATKCSVIPASATRFQVACYYNTLEADTEKKECTCGKWNLKGIPCCHSMAALFYLHKDVESYVDKSYTIESYLVAYSGSISPLAGESHWP